MEEPEVITIGDPCDRCGEVGYKDLFYCNNCDSCQICGCCPCYRIGCEECQYDGRQANESIAQYHARIDREWELEIGEPLRNTDEQRQMDVYVERMQSIVDKRK